MIVLNLLIVLWLAPGIGLLFSAISYDIKVKRFGVPSLLFSLLLSLIPVYNIVIWMRTTRIIEQRKRKVKK